MPSFTFVGLVATVYPFDRDATGHPLGEVQPGDVRDLDRALDWQWVAVEPGDGQDPRSGIESAPDPADVPAAAEPAPAPDAAPEPAPASPVPAPPAVVPPGGAFAVTAGQQ